MLVWLCPVLITTVCAVFSLNSISNYFPGHRVSVGMGVLGEETTSQMGPRVRVGTGQSGVCVSATSIKSWARRRQEKEERPGRWVLKQPWTGAHTGDTKEPDSWSPEGPGGPSYWRTSWEQASATGRAARLHQLLERPPCKWVAGRLGRVGLNYWIARASKASGRIYRGFTACVCASSAVVCVCADPRLRKYCVEMCTYLLGMRARPRHWLLVETRGCSSIASAGLAKSAAPTTKCLHLPRV